MRTREYTVDEVQNITNVCLPNYTVLDLKRVSDGTKYGHKTMVLLKCPCDAHSPYWTDLQVIKHKHQCRCCVTAPEYLSEHKKQVILQACKRNNLTFLNIVPSNTRRFQSVIVKVADQNGFWYNVTVDHLKYRTVYTTLKFQKNPYAVHNIQRWLQLYHPDYEFVDSTFTIMRKKYLFKYIGNEIEFTNDQDRYFTTSMNNMIYAKALHPLIRKFRKSYGALLTRVFLQQHGLKYVEEQTFDDLLSVRGAHLFFDFFLNNQNVAIEVDGQQHYEPIKHFGGELGYKQRVENDQIKNNYCQTHHIKLIRIPYYTYGSKKQPKNDYLLILEKLLKEEGVLV